MTYLTPSYHQQQSMGGNKREIDLCQSQQGILQLLPATIRLHTRYNVDARRPAAHPTVPAGWSILTVLRCACVVAMKRCLVT